MILLLFVFDRSGWVNQRRISLTQQQNRVNHLLPDRKHARLSRQTACSMRLAAAREELGMRPVKDVLIAAGCWNSRPGDH
jgi:hypothetical protein